MPDQKKEPMPDEQERKQRALEEVRIHKIARETKLERKTWESMIVFAMFYELRGVEMSLQHHFALPENDQQRQRALADIYLPQYKILVEVDEQQHNEYEDKERDDLICQSFINRDDDPPEIHRISVRKGNVYGQLDSVIQRVKELMERDKPVVWDLTPKAGGYTESCVKELLEAGIFAKMDTLCEWINEQPRFRAFTHGDLREAERPSPINVSNGEYGFHVDVGNLEVCVTARKGGNTKFILVCNDFVREKLSEPGHELCERENNKQLAIPFNGKNLQIEIRNCPRPYFVFGSIIGENEDEENINRFSKAALRSDDEILKILTKLADLQE